MAGAVLFLTDTVAHAQYIAVSEQGRKFGALESVIDYCLQNYSEGRKYFDFGISTEDEGRVLNEGLVSQKEGFGARGICHDFYHWQLKP